MVCAAVIGRFGLRKARALVEHQSCLPRRHPNAFFDLGVIR